MNNADSSRLETLATPISVGESSMGGSIVDESSAGESSKSPSISKTNEPNRSRLPSALRALRHRNFRLFFFGQITSLTGTWMQWVAQWWLVYELTGSSALLGMVAFCGQIPVFLFASIGGTLADRHNRHRVIICTQTIAMILAFTLAAITLAGVVQVWHVFVLASMVGLVNAFDIPARQAFVVDMVGREDLMNAIALNSSMVNGARIVGPALGGIVVFAVGEGFCFLLNALSFAAVLASLLHMNVKVHARVPVPGSALASIVEGFVYVSRTRPIRAILLLLGLTSLMGMPYSVLMPVIVKDILHEGSLALGILMGCSGCGALAGTLALATRKGIRGLGKWTAFSCTGFGVSLILFSFSRVTWLSAVLLVPVGCCMMVTMASSNTLIQSMVPDKLRGRVMAVYSMMFMGMAPFGALLAGFLAERVGPTTTVALGGTVCIAGGLTFLASIPGLRAKANELIIAQQATGGDPPEEITGQASAAAKLG